MHNTEDKQWWVIDGRKKEDAFVDEVCPRLNINAKINPEKFVNPFAADLIVGGSIADLKCQQTPFFKARVLYSIDPQYAVTFNRKDFVRYSQEYPHIMIFFWIDWQVLEMTIASEIHRVAKMSGIFKTHLSHIGSLIKYDHAPLHTYQRRVDDSQGNARDSYIFDLREFNCLYVKEEKNFYRQLQLQLPRFCV